MKSNVEPFKKNNSLKVDRQMKIRRLVVENGQVFIPELSDYFSVSEATIRRDLNDLNGRGWVQRTHGGAVRLEQFLKEPPIIQRVDEQTEEKRLIGHEAVKMLNEGETIFLGCGTTVLAIAQNLPEDIELRVITNSLLIVNEIAYHSNLELIVTGGFFRQSELSMVGHITEQSVREFRANRVFIGVRAIDPRYGLTNDYLHETITDRAIRSISQQVIVVADYTKFGRQSSVLLGPITAANIIITDSKVDKDIIEEIRELGVIVNIAEL